MNGTIVSYPDRGNQYGSNKWRGNCSGRLIEDIIKQYRLTSLNDYMVGSGTTRDVCEALHIDGSFYDLHSGYDMLSMDIPERAENIFWHPPYHDMILYSDHMYKADEVIKKFGYDPRENDLSRCKDWQDFLKKTNYCMVKQFTALEKGGRMFLLCGDLKRKGKLYSMLDIARPGTLEQIIIKAQHNCWSNNQVYSGKNFVPIAHEYLIVLKKEAALIFPLTMTVEKKMDVRNSQATWRDVIAGVLQDMGNATLDEIYHMVENSVKCRNNSNWQAKVRQTLQLHKEFVNVERGVWKYAA